MKRALIAILLLIVVLVGGQLYFSSQPTPPDRKSELPSSSIPAVKGGDEVKPDATTAAVAEDPGVEILDDVQPASKIFKSYEEAIAAVRTGAAQQDDLLLEQFRLSGSECEWCDQVYKDLRKAIGDSTTPKEQVLYFSEILALSGKVENLKEVAEQIRSGTDPETVELLAQAFEFAKGSPEVVQFLSYELQSTNDRLREAAVAALTNQSTLDAATALYQHTVSRADPNGYSDVGIGLAEFVPDEEVFPFLKEQALKRDAYSHLAIKSLLNNGLPGLKLVFEILEEGTNSEKDREMLKDAIDHVLVDEELESFVRQKIKDSKAPLVQEFGKQITDRLEGQDAEGAGLEPQV